MSYTQTKSRIISDNGFFSREEVFVKIGLKKCPFCGGKGHTQHSSSDEYPDLIYIQCEKCGNMSGDYLTHEEAASAWNRRPDADH